MKVYNTEAILNSFTCTIDYPAVFSGVATTGFEVVGRGAECSVTAEAQVKYDGNTKGLVNSFDTQTSAIAGNCFNVVNNGNYGIEIDNGVLTEVAYNEGDMMMLDVSMKAVDDGTDELLIVDLSD